MSADSRPGYDRRTVWSWSLYDFANSAFTTLVVTFLYATYFTQEIAADEIQGTALWSRGVWLTALIVALASPVAGAFADRAGCRKLFLLISSVICIAATAALYPVLPGQVATALTLFVIANVAFEMGLVFYNAFLPDIAPPDRIGRISGNAWALGYAGGLLALVVALFAMVLPEQPWFGLSTENGQNIRAINLLVAGWFAVFSVPIFLWVQEDRSRVTRGGGVVRASFTQLFDSFRAVRRYRQVARFLVARMIYNDGLVTVFAFGGIYAAGTFGFSFTEVLVFGIVLNVAAGLGAFGMARVDDRLGGRRTILISIVGLAAGALLAIFAPNRALFWTAGILVGIFSGPNQSASRSLMGRFVPPERENEFFGFFAFSGKATAFVGPLMLGVLTTAFGSQRAGMSIVVVLLVVGGALLLRVDEAEGIAAAQRDAEA